MDLNIDNIINAYFTRGDNILVSHQINSFNNLIDNIIPNLFSQYFPITLNYNDNIIKTIILKITKIDVGQPFSTENNGCSKLMTPNMASVKNASYLLPIYVNFETEITFRKNKLYFYIFIRIDSSARETFKNGVSCHITPSENRDTVP